MDEFPKGRSQTGERDTGTLIKEQVMNQTQTVVDGTQQMAGQVADQAMQRTTTMLESQKSRATDMLNSLAQALHQTGDTLDQQSQAPVGGVAHQAAGRIENVSGYLQNRSVNDLVYEAEDFARRNPVVVLGGAFALGTLVARFLKSSSPSSGTTGTRHNYPMRNAMYGSNTGGPTYQQYGDTPSYTGGYSSFDRTATGYSAGTQGGAYNASASETTTELDLPEDYSATEADPMRTNDGI